MLCPRCNIIKTGGKLCSLCKMKVTFGEDTMSGISDKEIIEHYALKAIHAGCRECGSKKFAFEAGVKEENKLKWYIILVQCDGCNINYEEVLEVRMKNESVNNDEQLFKC